MRVVFLKKSKAKKAPERFPEEKLEYFRKLLLDHLDTLDSEGGGNETSHPLEKAGFPVGTIRVHKDGVKRIKLAPGKWRPKYDSYSRGAKMAIAAIKRKINSAKTSKELMDIVMENRDRFSDANGDPLPFVQELSRYVREREGQMNPDALQSAAQGGNNKKKAKDPPKKKAVDAENKENAKQEKQNDKEWVNPLKEFALTWPATGGGTKSVTDYNIAATAVNLWNHRDEGSLTKEKSDRRKETYKKIGWSDEASEKLEKYFLSLTTTEARKAKFYADSHLSEKEPERPYIKDAQENFKKISNILGTGKSEVVHNENLGDITVDAGETGKKGYGLKHIIEDRAREGRSEDEIAAVLHLVIQAAREGKITRVQHFKDNPEHKGRLELEKDGIVAILSRQRNKGDNEHWLLTGFDDHKKKEEATEAIQTVIAQYGHSPEFSGFRTQVGAVVSSLSTVSPGSGEKSRENDDSQENIDFNSIRDKYQGGKSIEGSEDEIYVGDEALKGRWKLVEADTPTASHDESTFYKTPGFPANADGSSINDRDYEHFQANKEAVINIASEFDGRALKFDNPVIVTKDGIVISGNNRTMSSKIAARKGTDKKYIEALKKRAKKFGFTEEQVSQFKNPRVVFEVKHDGGYTTEQFAKFNESTKKTMGPTERAIKVSKMMKPETIETVAGMIGEYDTMGDLYKDQKASQKLIKTFQDAGLIGQNAEGEFVENGVITPAGKSFIETALLGSVVNEANLRGFNRPGCLSIRQTMVRALAPLVENKGLSGYSINEELNEALDIAMQVAIEKDKFKSVEDWSRQPNFFENPPDRAVVELAKRLEGTQKAFAGFIQEMNAGLKFGANGEADIFLGGVETKEQILSRFLGMKKSIMATLDFFRNRLMKKSDDYRQLAIEGIESYSEKLDLLKYGEKAIAVDFDGVINSFKNGWKGPTETDEPVLSAAESIATLFHRGYKIIIFSTRASTEEGVKTIREYLLKHTEDPGLVEKIEITDKKPIAHVYIDDRAIPFVGDWAETLKQIDEFKPWTERDNLPPLSKDTLNLPDGIYEGLRAAYEIRLNNGISFNTINGIRCSWKYPFPCTVEVKDGVPYPLEKSLTWSGYKLEDRYKVQGMDISIENKKGSTRSGTDKDGHDWSITMKFDYGYIRGTVGKDKDHLDCYVGPDRESERVFVVHQNDPVTGSYDEDKVMLCFSSEEEARKAYLSQYDRPGFLGDIIEMGIEEFKETIFDENNKGRKIEGGSADEN